jgi:hypothetical protein
MARSRDISKVLSSNTTLATDAEVAASYLTTASANALYAPVAAGGLVQITPTSIAATGGSGSISATGAVSFTTCTAISLNGCFNSTYDNYKIILEGTRSTSNAIYMRYRASGVDTPTSGSIHGNAYIRNTGSSAAVSVIASNSDYFDFLGAADSQSYFLDMSVNDPFTTNNTLSITNIVNGLYSTVQLVGTHWGRMPNSTTYDGITFYTSTGTMSGTIRVYGYKN